MESVIQTLAIYALPVVFAITLHEAAHGYVARHFGDPTAWMLGRISLNPLRHIDPVGTVLVPAILFWTTHGAFLFGWAKPVPVDFGNFYAENLGWGIAYTAIELSLMAPMMAERRAACQSPARPGIVRP